MGKNILFTANVSWNIYNFRRVAVDYFLRKGNQVGVLASSDDYVERLENLGCSFFHLKCDAKSLSSIGGVQLFLSYMSAYRSIRPDIVFSYTIKNNIFGALAAKCSGIPFVPNVTGLGTAFLSGGALEKTACMLYRLAFARLPVVFFQNEDDRSLFLERRLIMPHQARLLRGSGINLLKFQPTHVDRRDNLMRFLMVSRPLKDKGIIEFVSAASLIKKERPEVKFQLLGPLTAENRSAISEAQVNEWISTGVIEHLGQTDDVRPFLAKADCVVLPSYREGAPRTLIEAAAMGRPLISTDVPGCRSVVEHDVNGLLCDARSAGSLAKAMRQFIAYDPEKRKAMGIAGRTKMEREFDQKSIVEAYRFAFDLVTREKLIDGA